MLLVTSCYSGLLVNIRPALSALLIGTGTGFPRVDTLSDVLLHWLREARTLGVGDLMRFFIFIMKCIMEMEFKKEF